MTTDRLKMSASPPEKKKNDERELRIWYNGEDHFLIWLPVL